MIIPTPLEVEELMRKKGVDQKEVNDCINNFCKPYSTKKNSEDNKKINTKELIEYGIKAAEIVLPIMFYAVWMRLGRKAGA